MLCLRDGCSQRNGTLNGCGDVQRPATASLIHATFLPRATNSCGAAGSATAQIDPGDAENVARGFIEDDKMKLTWKLPRVFLPKNRAKLLLNLLLIAMQAIPRGGMIMVEPIGEGETMSFRVSSVGMNARVPPVMELLNGGAEGGTVDAHAIQPYYTGLLARECGMAVSIVAEGDAIVFTAQLADQPVAA